MAKMIICAPLRRRIKSRLSFMQAKRLEETISTDTFWQPILYLDNETTWPSSYERSGYWLGVADNIGDLLTYWIFDDQSKQVLARSVVHPYNNNKRVKWDPKFRYQSDQGTAQHGGILSLQRVLFLKN